MCVTPGGLHKTVESTSTTTTTTTQSTTEREQQPNNLNYYTVSSRYVVTTSPGPIVDVSSSGNLTVLLGQRASLRCRVLNLGNGTVSWIRHRDLHLLTVNAYTYTSDQRFQALFEASTKTWVLLVASVQLRDRGIYECQIGTTPPQAHFVHLDILEPRSEILGGTDLHINAGSTINLTCLLLYHAKPPNMLNWLHNGTEIRYDGSRGGVSILTEAGEVTRSALLIQEARPHDSGTYTCSPQGANNATANVHVLKGEHQAFMYSGATDSRLWTPLLLLVMMLILLLPFQSRGTKLLSNGDPAPYKTDATETVIVIDKVATTAAIADPGGYYHIQRHKHCYVH
ncbi:unnamed protein product [Meganyctiphanes norvegica]|uniref:Ig-like domain-containing protein n=1 Tax=Meganyctiphanes norvegica TaxID=48144 RepID=A0AAV2PVC3_MEGNR